MAAQATRRRRRTQPQRTLPVRQDTTRRTRKEEKRREEAKQALQNSTQSYGSRKSSPWVMRPPGNHDRNSIHAYVCEDLRRARSVSLYTWTEAVFGLPSTKMHARARKIAELKWFEDEVIQEALVDFVRSSYEVERYDPFVHLTNRIIELARGALPGVGKKYPIDDFCFANSANNVIRPTPEHGALAAKRKPDTLGLTVPDALQLYEPGGTVGWPSLLTWGELKGRLGKPVIAVFNERRIAHGLTALDSSGVPKDWSKERIEAVREGLFADKPKTRRRRAKSTKGVTKANETQDVVNQDRIKAGRKRFGQENLLADLDKSSTAKRRHSTGTSAEVYDNASMAIQSSSYALELLSGTYGTRTHCIGFVLKSDRISLWYYDAAGVVYTEEFVSMVDDFELFAAVIVGFACCTPEQFGIMPSTILKAPSRSDASLFPINLEKRTLTMTHIRSKLETAVTLVDSLFTQYALMGRRTFLYSIKTRPIAASKPLIAKFSWQVCTRKAEQDLVAAARKAGVKHLPRIHMWAEVWKLSEGIRRTFYEKGKAAFEDRTLRAIVYTQYSSIKELFSYSPKLIPVMVVQMIDCLHDLRYKANMLHRDISANNIMYEIRNGRHHFILIDFDMAVILPTATEGSVSATANHRTGTLPFMACELLYDATVSQEPGYEPIPHLLRHDYESLFWVSLWCVLTLLLKSVPRKERAKLSKTARRLEEGDLVSIAGRKVSLSTRSLDRSITLPRPARALHNWFLAWGDLLLQTFTKLRGAEFQTDRDLDYDGSSEDEEVDDMDGVDDEDDTDEGEDEDDEDEDEDDTEKFPKFNRNALPPGFDWETVDGLFTRENLKAILTKAFKIPSGSDELVESEESDTEDHDTCDVTHQAEVLLDESTPAEGKVAKVTRSTRAKRIRPARPPPTQPLENDIRSRLRPRKPRKYT
ncbi:hypothetical protein EIP86_009590 [Pleurotus ostreatoroseus]|nr:hypothetical protein EIP86_009590 [Pleurotus ostreatoroseus]